MYHSHIFVMIQSLLFVSQYTIPHSMSHSLLSHILQYVISLTLICHVSQSPIYTVLSWIRVFYLSCLTVTQFLFILTVSNRGQTYKNDPGEEQEFIRKRIIHFGMNTVSIIWIHSDYLGHTQVRIFTGNLGTSFPRNVLAQTKFLVGFTECCRPIEQASELF